MLFFCACALSRKRHFLSMIGSESGSRWDASQKPGSLSHEKPERYILQYAFCAGYSAREETPKAAAPVASKAAGRD
jgi:hypothetical protein